MNPFIFREYDIRGVVEKDFKDDVVINLGKGFGTWLKRRGASVMGLSGDVRSTTPQLKQLFAQGAMSAGIDVVDFGIIPTPLNYYSQFVRDIDAAVQITGSHNPPEFNGFKLSYARMAFFGTQIQEIRELIQKNDFECGSGKFREDASISEAYLQELWSKIRIERPLKVVVDSGNAAGGLVAPELFGAMKNIELTELFSEIDSTFPNHHPDPTVEKNLEALIALMKTGNYDAGIAYDGDADRVGVVDNKGRIIWADQLMALFLPEVIKKPGTPIVFDVKCSQVLEDAVIKNGGKPIMWKTGHSLLKQKMHELGGPFGGEMSGHIFFADDYYGYDDAIYVSARLLQMISRAPKKLSDYLDELPKFVSTPEIRLLAESDPVKFEIAEKAFDYFSKHYDCITVDGVRVRFGDGWGLVRASNTQPVIVTRFEANNRKALERIRKLVMDKLAEFGKLHEES
ncbi:MAG: phosphomannomutase/phosphoglucomutase [Candidatus Marinimicrobia bacterium]|jgi:phosphomannomutase/phosphoglucomutase|nr:phosphomannomutase/phosphoglucomutase [Candidatus Neomarinimicrobiota bacterium]MDX9778496.1 phosphomannomutase/phosphoglucomutase [bacterium]